MQKSVGPPQSEWVYVVEIEWVDSTSGYVVREVSDFEYPDI